jgi:hypothetical protein
MRRPLRSTPSTRACRRAPPRTSRRAASATARARASKGSSPASLSASSASAGLERRREGRGPAFTQHRAPQAAPRSHLVSCRGFQLPRPRPGPVLRRAPSARGRGRGRGVGTHGDFQATLDRINSRSIETKGQPHAPLSDLAVLPCGCPQKAGRPFGTGAHPCGRRSRTRVVLEGELRGCRGSAPGQPACVPCCAAPPPRSGRAVQYHGRCPGWRAPACSEHRVRPGRRGTCQGWWQARAGAAAAAAARMPRYYCGEPKRAVLQLHAASPYCTHAPAV